METDYSTTQPRYAFITVLLKGESIPQSLPFSASPVRLFISPKLIHSLSFYFYFLSRMFVLSLLRVIYLQSYSLI